MKYVIKALGLFFATPFFAQTEPSKPFTFSGYAEIYYSYDFANPTNQDKPNFIYNHKRHNELNLNLAYVKTSYSKTNIRANMGLMVGNYAKYNLGGEPNWAQFIYEANVGLKLSKTKNIWLDTGVMPSHIGFESVVGADCWTLTRSVLAENSPYYETGVKLSYTTEDEKLTLSGMYLNGWQKIKKPNDIQTPSFGFQANYKPNKKLTLNYSNFIGTDKPDNINALRIFHNLYAIYEPDKHWGITTGFDIGTDKYSSKDHRTWFAPVLITRYVINSKNKIAARIEYYNDAKQKIINTNSLNGFSVLGTSLNYDYEIKNNLLWRIEIKNFQSKNNILNGDKKNLSFTTTLSFKLP